MFTHVAIHHPRPEHRDAVMASMHRVEAASRGAAGLIRMGPWREVDGLRLVGIATWESREAFEAAGPAIFAAVADDPFDLWETRPAETLYLEDASGADSRPAGSGH